MTTLIAIKGELFGDRRKLVNYLKSGIVGVRDENKIRKLPHCLYGVMGFEFSESIKKKSSVGKYFEHFLTIISAFDYFTDEHFAKHKFAKAIANKDDFIRFRGICRAIRTMAGKYLAKELESKGSGLIMLTRGRTFVADADGWQTYTHDDPIIVGSGKNMAAILIDHNTPISEVYHALRSSGCPTGTKFDKLTVMDDISTDFPPVCDDAFLAVMSTLILDAVKKRMNDGVFDQKAVDECHEDLTMVMATFLTMGKMKDGKTILSRKPVYDFKSPASRRTKAWKAAAALSDYNPAQEKK